MVKSIDTKSFTQLLENDLEQAKLVIAAQDVLDRLQKIAEHLAELGAEEIMPLSDNMKAAFGADVATDFEKTADQAIQQALETVRGARDVIDSAILRVQGNMDAVPNSMGAPNDMADNTGVDDLNPAVDGDAMAQEADPNADNMLDDQVAADDSFGGADAGADGSLGRGLKDSVKNRKALKENINTKLHSLGMNVLMNESIGNLIKWVVEDASKRLSVADLAKFQDTIQNSFNKDPVATAGWVGMKKNSIAASAQTCEPSISPSARDSGYVLESLSVNERKVRGIAKVIEANIIAYGHGRAASVVNQFTSTDLNENSQKTIIEEFKNVFGMSPAEYSVKLKKSMKEDSSSLTASTISPSLDPSNSESGDPDMTMNQKNNAGTGIASIASTVAAQPSAASNPVSMATSKLSAPEKLAVDTVSDEIESKTGSAPTTVSDLLKNAPSVLGENDIVDSQTKELLSKYSPDQLKSFVAKKEAEGKGDTWSVKAIKKHLGE